MSKTSFVITKVNDVNHDNGENIEQIELTVKYPMMCWLEAMDKRSCELPVGLGLEVTLSSRIRGSLRARLIKDYDCSGKTVLHLLMGTPVLKENTFVVDFGIHTADEMLPELLQILKGLKLYRQKFQEKESERCKIISPSRKESLIAAV